jgi:drug/metabolite transporter (DMT)-like permease
MPATRLRAGSRSETPAFIALLVMTAVWGSTFFLIKDIVTRLPVSDLLAVRFGIASLALLIIAGRRLRMSRETVRRGVLLGVLYGIAQLLQTAGLAQTAASVSGFITGLYVVATPLLSAAILRTRIPASTWVAVGLATIGLGILSLRGFSVGYGELLTLASAVVYAGHIVALGRLSTAETALSLSLVQMITITVVCGMAALSGGIALPSNPRDWWIMIYLAVVAGALTMVLQTWAQTRIDATRSAVIMAAEPVWAAGFAVAFGSESITVRMLLGGAAILAAMYLVEVAPRLRAVRSRAEPVGSRGDQRAGGGPEPGAR